MFWYMEIVSIEKKTFEMMLASFNALSEKVAALRRKSDGGRLERWLTGEEVCGQLMNRRFYYRPEEVRRLIPLIGTIYPDGK